MRKNMQRNIIWPVRQHQHRQQYRLPKLKVSYDAKNGNATLRNWTPLEYTFRYYIYRYDTATKYKCVSKVDQNTTSYKLESAGRTVKYKVRVRTLAEYIQTSTVRRVIRVTVQGRPGNVSDVSKKKKGKNLTFKWTKAKGAQGYILYRYDENAEVQKNQNYKKWKCYILYR